MANVSLARSLATSALISAHPQPVRGYITKPPGPMTVPHHRGRSGEGDTGRVAAAEAAMTTRWFVRNVPVDFNLKSGLTSLKLAALAPRLAGCAVRELDVAIAVTGLPVFTRLVAATQRLHNTGQNTQSS